MKVIKYGLFVKNSNVDSDYLDAMRYGLTQENWRSVYVHGRFEPSTHNQIIVGTAQEEIREGDLVVADPGTGRLYRARQQSEKCVVDVKFRLNDHKVENACGVAPIHHINADEITDEPQWDGGGPEECRCSFIGFGHDNDCEYLNSRSKK